MKLMKWLTVFAVAFFTAWILIFTFIQPPFKEVAAAHIFKWSTPSIPIYLYVAGAFGIGFGLGLVVALYNFISLQSKLHHKNKECAQIEAKLSDATIRIKRLEIKDPVFVPKDTYVEESTSPDVQGNESVAQ